MTHLYRFHSINVRATPLPPESAQPVNLRPLQTKMWHIVARQTFQVSSLFLFLPLISVWRVEAVLDTVSETGWGLLLSSCSVCSFEEY